jgi:hypothetical protein
MVATQEKEQTHGNRVLAGLGAVTGTAIVGTALDSAMKNNNLIEKLQDQNTRKALFEKAQEVQNIAIDNHFNNGDTNAVWNSAAQIKETTVNNVKELASGAKNLVKEFNANKPTAEQIADTTTLASKFSEAGNSLKEKVGDLQGLRTEQKAALAITCAVTAAIAYLGIKHLTKPKTQVDTPTIEVDGMMQHQAAGRAK